MFCARIFGRRTLAVVTVSSLFIGPVARSGGEVECGLGGAGPGTVGQDGVGVAGLPDREAPLIWRSRCLHTDLLQLAETHGGPVHRPALLCVGRHRPTQSPQPPCPSIHGPTLHRLAEPARRRQEAPRSHRTGDRCLTRHKPRRSLAPGRNQADVRHHPDLAYSPTG